MSGSVTPKTMRALLLVALAAGSLATACHLFLDSDDLVSGEDGGNGPSSNPDASGVGEGGGVPVDLPDGFVWDASTPPEWKGQVPGCVPPIPLGATPLAVVGGEPGGTFNCPAGYEPDPNSGPAYGGVIDVGLYCTKHECTCGAYNPNAGGRPQTCEDLRLQYSNDPQCATNIGTDSLDEGCTRVNQAGATHVKVVGSVRANDQNCPPKGTAGIAKQTPRFGIEVRMCVPKAGAPPTCDDGRTPMPPAKDAVACYRASGGCAAGYVNHSMSLDKTFNDSRACQCQCDAKVDGGCTGGTVNLYGSSVVGFCQNQQGSITGTCQPIAAFGTNIRVSQAPTPPANAVACDPTEPRKTGNVTAAGQLMQLCCLSRCDSCKLAATSPNGTCEATLNACKTDVECEQYRQCANARCNAAECSQCEQLSDAGPPDSGFISQAALQKFRAIGTCQRNACPSPECP